MLETLVRINISKRVTFSTKAKDLFIIERGTNKWPIVLNIIADGAKQALNHLTRSNCK